jgi:hypothetical protein
VTGYQGVAAHDAELGYGASDGAPTGGVPIDGEA